jgi:transposase-like protein
MGKWRRHSLEFKKQAVERLKSCDNGHELARELQIQRKLLYTWKYQFEGRPEKNHANYLGKTAPETVETRLRREISELKEVLGTKAAEADFLAAALRRVNQLSQPDEANGEPGSTPKSGRRSKRRAS